MDKNHVVQYLESHGVQTRMLFSGNLIKQPCFDEMRKSHEGYRVVGDLHVTKQTSTWLAAGWVQISAFVVCLAAWCITGREPIGDLFRVKPWYLLLGGAIGAFITITVIWSMAGLGPAKAAMLIVISQLAAAWLIELFGLFGMEKTDFTVRKLLGMAVAVVGIVVFQWE